MSRARRAGAIALLVLCVTSGAHAQIPSGAAIATDGTLGDRVELPAVAGEVEIPESLGRRSSGSLLHSFERFGVPAQTLVDFSGGDGIERVLARVTGGAASRIDGTLRSSVPGADLYLINPAGVLFGRGGALDVPGDFHASTASALHLDDGTVFSTDPAGSVTLSWAGSGAWGFEDPPAAIALDGARLEVQAGRTLSLIGGDLRVRGRSAGTFGGEPVLTAPGGRVELVSVDSPGLVRLGDGGPDVSGLTRLGQIEISHNARVSTFGPGSGTFLARGRTLALGSNDAAAAGAFVFSDSAGLEAPAPLAVDIDVRDAVTLTGSAQITAELAGQPGSIEGVGGIRVRAGELRLDGTSAGALPSLISSFVSSGTGGGGDVELDVGALELHGGAEIVARTGAAGPGGDLVVRADRLSMSGRGTRMLTESAPRGPVAPGTPFGDAGDLRVEVRREAALSGLAQIFSRTRTAADGGDVSLTADEIRIRDFEELGPARTISSGIQSGEEPGAGGDPAGLRGALHVSARRIELSSGGQILSNSFAEQPDAQGRAAPPLSVEADELRLVGGGALIRTATRARDGGTLELSARTLELLDGGQVSGSVDGSGRGGQVAVDTEAIRISGSDAPTGAASGIFSQSLSAQAGAGPGGTVDLTTRRLEVSDGGEISVRSLGPGDAGQLRINADGHPWSTQAEIDVAGGAILSTAEPGPAAVDPRTPRRGGDIEIHARTLRLGAGGRIAARNEAGDAGPGSFDAGDVSITLSDALELDGGTVTTEAIDGVGGNVTVRTRRLVHLRASAITTSVSGDVGDGGNIDIDPDLVVLDRSRILARAAGGDGGNIRIVAGRILLSGDCADASCIDASSERGIDGEISLSSPIEDLSESTRPADPRFDDASDRLDRGCAARRTRSGSLTLETRVIRVGPQGVIRETETGADQGAGACRVP